MSDASSGGLVDAAVTFAIRVLSAGLLFGLQVLLARLTDMETYGHYVTLWMWLIAFGSFGAIGLAESSVRFLPRYRSRGREHYVHQYLRFGFVTVVAASSLLALLAITLAMFVGPDTPSGLIVLFVALGLPFLAIEYYLEGVARSFGWFRLTTVPVYILRPILIGALCLGLVAAGVELTLSVIGAVLVGSMALVSCALALTITLRLGYPHPVATSSKPQRRLWLRASLPLVLVSGLEDLLTYSDVLVLSMLLSPEQVGVYFAAARTLALANFVYFAMYLVSGRGFAIASAEADKARLQQSVSQASRLTVWMTVAALVPTLVAGPFLLSVFGEAFTSGYTVMLILALGLLARSIAGQSGELLIVLGRQRDMILIDTGILIANICLIAALVPLLGIHGAAIGASLALATRSLALILVVRRRTGLNAVSLAPPDIDVRKIWRSRQD